MKKLFKDFITFINKGNAIMLAIGVILGGAFTGVVTTINQKIISPLIGALCGDFDLSNSLVTVLAYKKDENGVIVLDEAGQKVIANGIYWGAFIEAIINFLITAIILFIIFKIVMVFVNSSKKAVEKARKKHEHEVVEEVVEPAPPVIDEKIELLTEIRDLLKAKEKNETK